MMAGDSKRIELTVVEGGRGGGPRGGPPPAPPEDGRSGAAIYGSHIQLKEALLKELGDDWRHAAGQWYGWEAEGPSGRWRRDELKSIWRLSTAVCKEEGSFSDKPDLARQIQSSGSVHAAASLASADAQVAAAMTDFDHDPWLLNTPAGIVDLRSGQLGPAARGLLMTKLAGAGPVLDRDGGCPLFRKYLEDATGGDVLLQKYLQRVAGYCLTGSIEEHCILFFHGPGGSGKTTFLLVIQDLLGDYAVNSPMNAFTVATGERHPTEFAHFFGARVVAASEVEEGMRWDEGKLKAISGGDKITARFMRGDFFTFEPQFKLLLAGNHRPRMRSADDAMRRRLQVVPFRHKPGVVDKGLREKLRGELGAILVWAIEGELDRRRLGGLAPPAVVVAATDSYFRDENTIGRWLDERCALDPAHWTETRQLHRDFADWAKRVGEFVLSERAFVQKLEAMPHLLRSQHPVTRRAGAQGVSLRYATADLFEGAGNGAPARRRGPAGGDLFEGAPPAENGPENDPGDDWVRE